MMVGHGRLVLLLTSIVRLPAPPATLPIRCPASPAPTTTPTTPPPTTATPPATALAALGPAPLIILVIIVQLLGCPGACHCPGCQGHIATWAKTHDLLQGGIQTAT